MDWNDRMTEARAEYEDLESKEATARERMEQATAQYEGLMQQGHSALATFALRKSQLEGQMSIIGELLVAGERPLFNDVDVMHDPQPIDAAVVLQGIVDTNPPEATLAILNGIEERLQEKEQTADA